MKIGESCSGKCLESGCDPLNGTLNSSAANLQVETAREFATLRSIPNPGDFGDSRQALQPASFTGPNSSSRVFGEDVLRCPNRQGHRPLLTGITDPFAIRGASLGPAKRDRKDPVGRSEEDPSRTSAYPPKPPYSSQPLEPNLPLSPPRRRRSPPRRSRYAGSYLQSTPCSPP